MKPLMLGFDSNGRPLHLDDEQGHCHSLVMGSSGSGKSKYLENRVRQNIDRRQGCCCIDPHGKLVDDVFDWCARRSLKRKITLLDLSNPKEIVGFAPFRRDPQGDISVQVDRRITATMHAWGEKDTNEKPTLERIFRLIYFALLEHNLGLPAAKHLINFNAKEVRAPLIERSCNPLIQAEWRELQQLTIKDWRTEMLAAKNRLFRLLTSTSLPRFMGLPGHSINLSEIIEEGGILLVRLAPSADLSHENARVFGALLVNEFFECAMRRKIRPSPKPYHLYLDEFQDYLSPSIAAMTDQMRKFGMFLTLSTQRFSALDDNTIDSVLTNCRIKVVFGGLNVETARRMAEELFIDKLDAKKIKVAIYQTKFWPTEETKQHQTHGTSHTSSSGGTSTASSGEFYGPEHWFGSDRPIGRSSSGSSGRSTADSYTETHSVADIPVFVPVPFQELSSVQYYTHEEQLTELTAALKGQFTRHCFIKIQNEETEPVLVPKVEDVYVTEQGKEWYRNYLLTQSNALPVAEVDSLLKQQEDALLQTITSAAGVDCLSEESQQRSIPAASEPSASSNEPNPRPSKGPVPIWNRAQAPGENHE